MLNGSKSLVAFLAGIGLFFPVPITNFYFDGGWFDINEVYFIPVIFVTILLVNYSILILQASNVDKTLLMSLVWIGMTLGIPGVAWQIGCNCVTLIQVDFASLSMIFILISVLLYGVMVFGERITYKMKVQEQKSG